MVISVLCIFTIFLKRKYDDIFKVLKSFNLEFYIQWRGGYGLNTHNIQSPPALSNA